MIVKVENFPGNSSKQEVVKLFKKFGEVSSVVKRSSKLFVRLKDNEKAKKAIKKLNGIYWRGKRLFLSEEKPKVTSSVCRTEHGVFNLF